MKKFLIKLVIKSDTKLGRRFDVFIGMGLVAVPTGLLASALSKTIGQERIRPSYFESNIRTSSTLLNSAK